jgi:hypothetical protein
MIITGLITDQLQIEPELYNCSLKYSGKRSRIVLITVWAS